jgi:pyruvate dehydrogenase E2 component (dihydrolipoamide acetyltransferase)
MLHELRLPDLGEGVTEGEIVDWLVAEGDRIEEDTPLVEVMTDKASVQIPSPVAGTVEAVCVAAGERVAVGTVLLAIRVGDPVPSAAGATSPPAPAAVAAPTADAAPVAAGEQRVRALPSTRRLARELGVDITSITGSGHDGRVTADDVRNAHAQGVATVGASANGAGTAPRPHAPAVGAGATRLPLRGRRRAIAEHLTRAAAVPTVTFVEEAEFDRLDGLRRRLEERDGVRLSYLPFVVRAVATALRQMPVLNGHVDEDAGEIVLEPHVHVGVAVDTDEGLVVPVVRDAGNLGVRALASAIDELSAAARAGTLRPEQLRGSTFTLTSAGRWGGLVATPLINHPEIAVLGVHRARPRPVVHDGEIVVRTVGNISLTFDHRAVDGVVAARFVKLVIDAIEEPGLLAVG